MVQGNNNLVCPKCQKEGSYLISIGKGIQYLVCQGCAQLMKAEVKNGQFTGKVSL